ELTGRVKTTFLRGVPICHGGKIIGPARGQYLRRPASSDCWVKGPRRTRLPPINKQFQVPARGAVAIPTSSPLTQRRSRPGLPWSPTRGGRIKFVAHTRLDFPSHAKFRKFKQKAHD